MSGKALVWLHERAWRNLMNLDASLSLEVILAILAILGGVWRLEGRIVEARRELRGDNQRLDTKIDDVQQRLETKIDDVHQRLDTKIDDVQQRLETRMDRLDARIDEVDRRLGERIDEVDRHLGVKIDEVDRRLGHKIDDGNQRLARLEGRLEGREERLAAEGETQSPA